MTYKNMTYQELEQKLAMNRRALRDAADSDSRRHLIREDHELMTEMDFRWNAAMKGTK